MKIVSWNCQGKFREKHKLIKSLDADIYVIQECENPLLCNNKEYKKFASNYFWVGDNKNKGLGIFAKDEIKLKKNNWNSYCLRNFLSVKINDKFDILGIWACKPYIEEYYIYQSINIKKYNNNTIIIGDFNSNKIWDSKHQFRDHSLVVKELKQKKIESIYHYKYNELQGEESINTYYMYRHLDRGYHIDHCFTNIKNVKNYTVLENLKWLEYSDHMPIILESNL